MDSSAREHKGKSIISFPNDYCVIDIETTGLDYNYCDIIEVSALRIRSGSVFDSFSSLVRPPVSYYYNDAGELVPEFIDSFIEELTGITNEMLFSAPEISSVVPSFIDFVSSDILIGHNVNFDVNFLYDSCLSCGFLFSNSFVDTMRVSRKLLPDLKHHRLKDIAKHYGVSYSAAHRAAADCDITNRCYQIMRNEVVNSIGEESFVKSFNRPRKKLSMRDISPLDGCVFDDTNILFGKVVVFTGALSSMARKDAMQLVVNCGGLCADSVTKKTNFLVIGNEDFASSVKNGKTTKMKKAEEMIAKDSDMQILSEAVFLSIFE